MSHSFSYKAVPVLLLPTQTGLHIVDNSNSRCLAQRLLVYACMHSSILPVRRTERPCVLHTYHLHIAPGCLSFTAMKAQLCWHSCLVSHCLPCWSCVQLDTPPAARCLMLPGHATGRGPANKGSAPDGPAAAAASKLDGATQVLVHKPTTTKSALAAACWVGLCMLFATSCLLHSCR